MPDSKSRQPAHLEIRAKSSAELDLALAWATEEGWNPGLADAECFHVADPDGFLMAFRDGEPVASISVVRYDEAFAFLGFYIVRPAFRGRGYGLRLWQAGMARLEGRTVGLDGVVAQQANYARAGFVLAHRNSRFGGDVRVEAPSDARLVAVDDDLVPAVLAFDRRFFPASRESFLRCWLRPDRRSALALVENGRVRGYGVIRDGRTGRKIGPLFAASSRNTRAPPNSTSADVPEPNRSALDLAGRYGLTPAFETARMYRGATPALPLDQIYGITSFELG